MDDHKTKIIHHVDELCQIFGVRPSHAELYTFAEQLEKSIGPYVTTQVVAHGAKVKLSENNVMAPQFLKKYETLKMKNLKELDPFINLLSLIKDDQEVHSNLTALIGPQTVASDGRESRVQAHNYAQIQKSIAAEGSANTMKYLPLERIHKIGKEKSRNKQISVPMQPDWIFERPGLSNDFLSVDNGGRQVGAHVEIGVHLIAVQEQAIVDDLLHCMMGVDGVYITSLPLENRNSARRFHVDQTLDRTLLEAVHEILPVCTNYSAVVRFIEEKSAFEYGRVNHSLAAAMRTLIKDFTVLVCQLEQQQRLGQLRLNQMLFYLQDTAHLMAASADLAAAVNSGECLGGAVLSLLHDRAKAAVGDAKVHELYRYLMRAASVPFYEILQKWLYRGTISDPFGEFMIDENRDTSDRDNLTQRYINDYWLKHYTVNRKLVPTFLDPCAEKILKTGKYLNVAHQCKMDRSFPQAEELVYDVSDRRYEDQIERAFSYASRTLMDLMLKEKELKERLKSVKHYFLLDQGDFIVHFMDAAEDEMRKGSSDVSLSRLESLLELVLRTSTANIDQHKDNLRVVLLSFDLISQMFEVLSIQSNTKISAGRDVLTDSNLTGLEAFSFDYHVEWPLSLVLNRRAMDRYQMLFRHLFYCKHVERLLCNVWLSNKSAKTLLSTSRATSWYSVAFALRQRMLNFVQHFQYYMTVEVIEPTWRQFFNHIENASTLDEVLDSHMAWLCSCLEDCMLTNPDLLRVVHKLMMVCVTFSNFIQRLSKSSDVLGQDKVQPIIGSSMSSREKVDTSGSGDASSRRAQNKAVSEDVDSMVNSDSFELTIEKFNENFNSLCVELLEKIREEHSSNHKLKIMNMVSRLDFNGFYSGSANKPGSTSFLGRSTSSSALKSTMI